jgi:hypothetical protein
MADFSLMDLFGNTDTGLGQYLSEEQKRQLQGQANMSAAAALLKAGAPRSTPGGFGSALAEGLMAGQQGYQRAQEGAFQNLTMAQKLLENKQAQQARSLFPQIFKQENVTTPEYAQYQKDLASGNVPMTEAPTQFNQQLRVDPTKLHSLAMLSPNPLEAYANFAKVIPELRRSGLLGGGQQENPFAFFTQDETIPLNVRQVAQQYATSFASGNLTPEKVDERVKQLSEMTTRVSQYQQTQEGINAQREATRQNQEMLRQLGVQGLETRKSQSEESNRLARESLALREEAQKSRPEQFSKIQLKDFEIVSKDKEQAKQAEDSASIAQRAVPLIQQAYTGVLESGVKNIAGAIGYSTEAKDANDALLRLQNQLSVKTPKFSGSTSNLDAARYDKAVGDLANPRISRDAKLQSLKDIIDLSNKAKDYATQQENYYYDNNKSLRGFTYTPPNPFGR